MELETRKNEIKKARQEAWQVYGALLCAVGQNMHEKLKRFSTLLSPPTRAASRGNGKVMAAMSSKRKASTDNLMQQQQPPLKKIATDGPGGVVPMNSMSVDNMQGSTSGFSSMMGFPNIGMSSSMGEYMCRIDPT